MCHLSASHPLDCTRRAGLWPGLSQRVPVCWTSSRHGHVKEWPSGHEGPRVPRGAAHAKRFAHAAPMMRERCPGAARVHQCARVQTPGTASP